MSKKRLVRQIDLSQGLPANATGGGIIFVPITPPDPGDVTGDKAITGLLDDDGTLVMPNSAGRVQLTGGAGVNVDYVGDNIARIGLEANVVTTGATSSILLAPGSVLLADIGISQTIMQTLTNIFANNDFVVLRSAAGSECVKITSSAAAITGGYEYKVLRAQNGSTEQNWSAGQVVLRLGATGDTFMELSGQTSESGTTDGPVLAINKVTSATPAWQPVALLGNLKGNFGLAADAWGAGFGLYGVSGEPWLFVESGAGVKIVVASDSILHITPTGDIKQYTGGVQRSQFAADGSGWLAGANKISWDTSGNLSVSGNLTAGAGSTISGDYIVANTITASKLNVVGGGANLVANSTFGSDSDSDGLSDAWIVYNNSAGTQPITASRQMSGGVDSGVYQRVAWSVSNTTSKGLYTDLGAAIAANRTYVVSFWAKASLNSYNKMGLYGEWTSPSEIANPVLTTAWQRYAFRKTLDASVTDTNLYISILYGHACTGSLDIDHVQVEEGDLLSNWKPRPGEAAPGSITGDMLVADTITAREIGAGVITGNEINAATLISVGSSTPRIEIDGANKRIQTSNYASGVTGFRMDGATGNAEFNNITARGAITASIFEKKVVTAVAGGIIIAKSAGKLAATYTVSGTMTIESPPDSSWAFATGDIVRLKAEYSGGMGDTWVTVTRTGTTNQYTTVYNSGTNSITYPAGTGVVDYGVSGQGIIMLTADEGSNTPYIDIATHAGSPWSAMTLKARLGNLAGVAGASGYGLWSDNVFLTGALTATGGNTLITGGAASDVNNGVTTISGGKITTGSVTASQLSATAIDGMTVTGATVRTAASGARVEMNATKIFGTDGVTEQWSASSTDGKLKAAGGNTVLDAAGLRLLQAGAAVRFEANGSEIGRLYSNEYASGGTVRQSVALARATYGTELIANQSFETNTTGWTLTANGAGASAQRDAAAAHVGSYGTRLILNGGICDAGLVSDYLTISADQTLQLSFWYKIADITGPGEIYISFGVEWFNSSNASLGLAGANPSSNVTGEWRQYTKQAVAPANTAKCKVYAKVQAINALSLVTLYADDFSAVKTAGNAIGVELTDANAIIELGSTGALAVRKLDASVLTVDGSGNVTTNGAIKPVRGGTTYTGRVFVPLTAPLTSTSWDGDAFTTTAKTKIDMSAVFGAPADIKAVLVSVDIRDSGAASSDAWLLLAPNSDAGYGMGFSCLPANDRWNRLSGTIPCDANGDIYYQTGSTGSGTLDIYIQVWGYWI